ncbi:MAG: type II secretion system secretin GspD [Proteobacteria bacterium]|nr:type II secretion system secretin GspD [Pseudomonadota bacterium]
MTPERTPRPNASRMRLLCLSLCLIATLTGPVRAEEDKVTLNFVNADIETVTKAVSQITGKNFLLDPRVKGTVNVVSSKPVPQSLAYHFLLSALRMQGFAAVENNGVVRIMPEADAKTHGSPAIKGGGGPSGDQMLTKVFPLRYESATLLVPILRPLIAPNNSINANSNNNSLIISDYADNLARLEKIIHALDTPYGEEPQIIPIRYASVIDLAATLNKLYGEGAGAGDASQRATLLADTRSNSLIVRSDNPGKLARIRTLVETLDQPTAVAGNIHVVYLKNAEAVKVAQTLRAIISGETSTPTAGLTPLSANPSSSLSTQPGGTQPGMTQNTSLGGGTSGGTGGSGAGFIQADATNNALIITAPEAVYQNLRRVIDMLDKRRAQVLVEALIAELSSDRASEFGIQWLGGGTNGGTSVIGGTNFGSGGQNIMGLIQNIATAKHSGSLGVPPGLNLGIFSGKDGLGVLARVLETDAKANILSTPSLLTLDNEEARIVIGSNVPFLTGQYAQTGTTATATPFQTYDRKDVGLTLKIRPQISEGGLVRMQIFQEASSIQPGTLSNASGPITNKRSIETAVVVDDGGIIVIGGLIEDSYGMGEDKVPLLGDIPGLGVLFRYDTRKRTKTNLMVFLRPQIIRDAAGYQGPTRDRYDYVIGEQKKTGDNARLMLGEGAVPSLPAFGTPSVPPSPAAPPALGKP